MRHDTDLVRATPPDVQPTGEHTSVALTKAGAPQRAVRMQRLWVIGIMPIIRQARCQWEQQRGRRNHLVRHQKQKSTLKSPQRPKDFAAASAALPHFRSEGVMQKALRLQCVRSRYRCSTNASKGRTR